MNLLTTSLGFVVVLLSAFSLDIASDAVKDADNLKYAGTLQPELVALLRLSAHTQKKLAACLLAIGAVVALTGVFGDEARSIAWQLAEKLP